MNEVDERLRQKKTKHTSDKNMQISLGLMANALTADRKNLRWGNKVNCKAVADYVYNKWSEICPHSDKDVALTNLEKDISSGLKLLHEMRIDKARL
nr:hypothetical protein [uncultured Vibrio sp.]